MSEIDYKPFYKALGYFILIAFAFIFFMYMIMKQFMISISNITKNMSGVPLYEGATFQVNPGEKVSLVGPNGVGKSTFFRMIMGEEKPDVGQISKGSDTRVSYFSQNVGEMKGRTALEEVMAGHGRMDMI